MKGRLVDTLLIITLVLVAFGITYTLLTLNRNQTRPPTRPGSTEAPAGSSVIPIIPESLAGNPASVTPLVPGAANPLNPVTAVQPGTAALPEVTAGGVFADLLRLAAYLGARL